MSAGVKIIRFDDHDGFAQRVTPFLMRREAENCFFLGFVSAFGAKPNAMLIAIEDERDDVVGVAVQSPDRHMMLTDTTAEAAIALAEDLARHNHSLPGLQSRRTIAAAFAGRYCALTGLVQRGGAALAVHVLTALQPIPAAAGRLRIAREADIDLLAVWFERFCIDVNHPTGDNLALARERVGNGTTFIWELNGQPVSTVSLSGPTPNGIRISLVYTPPEHRSHGYASACVASLTKRMLESGKKFCFLFTELANPTSNKIYRTIGYEKVCEQTQIFFDPRV